MGYYSDFRVSVYEVHEDGTLHTFSDEYCEQILKELETITQYSFENVYEWCLYDCKWYEMVNDMKKLSESHPNIVFRVNRWGEEDGDIECCMYRNGKEVSWRPEPVKLISNHDLFDMLQDPRPQTEK